MRAGMGRIVAQGVDELLGRVAACAHLFCIDGVALEGFVGADDVFAVHEGFAGFTFMPLPEKMGRSMKSAWRK